MKVTVDLKAAAAVIADSAREVLASHDYAIVKMERLGATSIDAQQLDDLFRELGNNTSACLAGIDETANPADHNESRGMEPVNKPVEKTMQNDNKALAVMNNSNGELAQLGSMSVQTIVDRKKKIREVLENVMVEGQHYGVIPGCGDKPSLFKPGAEVLATTFGLAPTFKVTRLDLPGGHREYEIVCTLHHIATGTVLGEGVGTCSTMESKYRWRNAQRKCPDCGQPTVLKSKNPGEGYFCWKKKGGCGSTWPEGAKEIERQELGKVENPDIADTYNTVLKMAKKRAQVDCTLTAVGASDILTQDLEDLPRDPGHVDGGDAFLKEADRRSFGEKPQTAPRTKPSKKTAAAASGKPQPVMTEDEIVDLIDQMSRCGTVKALQEVASRHRELVLGQQDKIRDRILRAHNAQLADVRAAEEDERRRAS